MQKFRTSRFSVEQHAAAPQRRSAVLIILMSGLSIACGASSHSQPTSTPRAPSQNAEASRIAQVDADLAALDVSIPMPPFEYSVEVPANRPQVPMEERASFSCELLNSGGTVQVQPGRVVMELDGTATTFEPLEAHRVSSGQRIVARNMELYYEERGGCMARFWIRTRLGLFAHVVCTPVNEVECAASMQTRHQSFPTQPGDGPPTEACPAGQFRSTICSGIHTQFGSCMTQEQHDDCRQEHRQ